LPTLQPKQDFPPKRCHRSKVAADQSGSSLEEVSKSVTKFTRLVGDAADGSEEAKEKLRKLGVDPQEAIKDLDGALAKVFERIVSLPTPVERTNAAIDAFGKGGAELLPFLQSFDGDLAGLIQKSKELGLTINDADAALADEFGDTLDLVSAQVKNLTFLFARDFLPVITRMMSDISALLVAKPRFGEKLGNGIWRHACRY
jgi:hypothetical protein